MSDVAVIMLEWFLHHPDEKIYTNHYRWRMTENLWRMWYLNAGESGEDKDGEWQRYTISDKGKQFLSDYRQRRIT